MNAETHIGGSCLCGAVSFRVALPSQWCAHCHCSLCRKAHGAAFVTWAGFDDSGFEITAGQDDLRWHASTPEAERGFCIHCGSSLFFRSKRWPGEIHVTVASLDQPLDRDPQSNVYDGDRVGWGEIHDGLKSIDPDA
jgi:hypothetical protein